MRKQLSVILAAALFSVSVEAMALEGPEAIPVESDDPRIGYFVSETGDAGHGEGFVLDRSGEKALLRFDKSREILVLDMVPGPQGVTWLKDGLGTTIMRFMPWGGATVYDADGSEGGAFGYVRAAAPLQLEPHGMSHVKQRAREISSTLASEFDFKVSFRFEPVAPEDQTAAIEPRTTVQSQKTGLSVSSAASGLDAGSISTTRTAPLRQRVPGRAGTMGDTLELVAIALERLVADDLALEVLSEKVTTIVLRSGDVSEIYLEEQRLVVTYVPEMGLYGRPSSARIERFLLENL